MGLPRRRRGRPRPAAPRHLEGQARPARSVPRRLRPPARRDRPRNPARLRRAHGHLADHQGTRNRPAVLRASHQVGLALPHERPDLRAGDPLAVLGHFYRPWVPGDSNPGYGTGPGLEPGPEHRRWHRAGARTPATAQSRATTPAPLPHPWPIAGAKADRIAASRARTACRTPANGTRPPAGRTAWSRCCRYTSSAGWLLLPGRRRRGQHGAPNVGPTMRFLSGWG